MSDMSALAPWVEFAVAFLAFLASHLVPARPRVRTALCNVMGERVYVAAYSAPSLILLGWLMKHPARISPVLGSTSPARIASCADAGRVAAELTRAEWYALWISARGSRIP